MPAGELGCAEAQVCEVRLHGVDNRLRQRHTELPDGELLHCECIRGATTHNIAAKRAQLVRKELP